MIYAKGTLYKLKQKTAIALLQETSHFRRIQKDAVFPNSTSDESDDDFGCSRYKNNDNHNHNSRLYSIQTIPCRYGTAIEQYKHFD